MNFFRILLIVVLTIWGSTLTAQQVAAEGDTSVTQDPTQFVEFVSYTGGSFLADLTQKFTNGSGGLLGFCATETQGLPSCDKVGAKLRELTALCASKSDIFLGLLDIDMVDELDPADFPGEYDSKTWWQPMLLQRQSAGYVKRVDLPKLNARAVAFMVCPQDLTPVQRISYLKSLSTGESAEP